MAAEGDPVVMLYTFDGQRIPDTCRQPTGERDYLISVFERIAAEVDPEKRTELALTALVFMGADQHGA